MDTPDSRADNAPSGASGALATAGECQGTGGVSPADSLGGRMLDLTYDYASCIRNSERVAWRLDDVLPSETRLDFSRPFLPEALARSSQAPGLTDKERLTLNQITGNAYLNLFSFVEEYILATVVHHAQAELTTRRDSDAVRALVRFADEEAKHQQLFRRFRTAFDRDFGTRCPVLDSAAHVAGIILSKTPIAVMLITLHLEIMTQQHYTDCVRDDAAVDPLFCKLLRFHWLEEAQHACIDLLELDKLFTDATREIRERGFDDYLTIVAELDGLLAQQAKLDLLSMENALGRKFDEASGMAVVRSQHQAYRYTFLVSGMTNPTFLDSVRKIAPLAAQRIVEKAATLSPPAA